MEAAETKNERAAQSKNPTATCRPATPSASSAHRPNQVRALDLSSLVLWLRPMRVRTTYQNKNSRERKWDWCQNCGVNA
eukprot:scaffold32055_cov20-Cyclotella_meneghiniana.AAC.1